MDSFEDIRRNWAQLPIENEILRQKNIELMRELSGQKIRSHQDKLCRAYRIGYIGFLFPLLALMMYHAIDMSVGICVFYSLFGVSAGVYDLWFMHYVREADYMSMPVVDAVTRASRVVKYQNWSTIISIMLAVAMLGWLFYDMNRFGDTDVIWGGIIGGIIGGAIGTVQCVKNHRHARQMLREIKNI